MRSRASPRSASKIEITGRSDAPSERESSPRSADRAQGGRGLSAPEMLERVRGKLRGELPRWQFLRKCGRLPRVEPAEVGRALGLCFRAQGKEVIPRYRKGGNTARQWPQLSNDPSHERAGGAPGQHVGDDSLV